LLSSKDNRFRADEYWERHETGKSSRFAEPEKVNEMLSNTVPKHIFVAAFALATMVASKAFSQSAQEYSAVTSAVTRTSSPAPSPARRASPQHAMTLTSHAKDFYQLAWGVDSLRLKAVESGLIIRFSYRVVNAEKAMALNDKKAIPYLVDEQTRRKLVIPTLEKVGELRQTGTPEVGKAYWMLFSNKGNFVKPGSRVGVVIGKFHMDGVMVQ
jgi:hypothetical protein